MGVKDIGVGAGSKIWFSEPSEFAKKNLFYLTEAGRYNCTPEYVYRASNFSTCILVVVDSGHLYLKLAGYPRQKISSGEAVIFNRRQPHSYYTDVPLQMRYLILSGLSTDAYVEAIIKKKNLIWRMEEGDQLNCNRYVEQLLQMIEARDGNEQHVSICLHKLLAEILSNEPAAIRAIDASLEKTVQYLHKHWNEPIRLETLANMAMFSTFHFAKQFKRWKGVTPYEYVLQLRVDESKRMLCTTTDSISRIALDCGFDSSSHFIYHFRKREGLTPAVFRRLRHEAFWEGA